MNAAICIACGCTDLDACIGPLDQPCHWLRVDRARERGVCSTCPDWIKRWDSGDLRLAPAAVERHRLRGINERLNARARHNVA